MPKERSFLQAEKQNPKGSKTFRELTYPKATLTIAYTPLRNLLLIFGGWELCSRPPKMSKGTERDQEKFFSRGLPSQIQHSTNTKKQTILTQKHCLFFCAVFDIKALR